MPPQQVNTVLLLLILISLLVFFFQTRRHGKHLHRLLTQHHRRQDGVIKNLRDEVKKINRLLVSQLASFNRQETAMEQQDAISEMREIQKEQAVMSCGELTLVLSLPKCGSSTIVSTIETQLQNKAMIHHAHCLSRQGLSDWLEHLSPFCNPQDNSLLVGMIRLWANESRKYRHLIKNQPDQRINLMGGVREPIGLLASFWFHFKNELSGTVPEDITPDQIRDWVMHTMSASNLPFLPFEKWFDQEIKASTGIDIFAEAFNIDKGYQIYKNGNRQVCLIRMDALDRLPDMLGEVFETPGDIIELKRENVAEGKSYGEIYRRITDSLRFPKAFIETVYNTPYARRFWSPDELAKYAVKWSTYPPDPDDEK